MNLIVRNIVLPYKSSKDEALRIAKRNLLKFFSQYEIIKLEISKRSVDARKKDNICFNYSVKAYIESNRVIDEKVLNNADIITEKEAFLDLKYGSEKLNNRPIIIGFGPAGMFCAYILTLHGYKPLVIERGADVYARKAIVDNFYKTRVFSEQSNIQYGAGGAGTFSDGKLMTRINSSLSSLVIDTFYKFGAPESILYEAKPHIGSDKLINIVSGFSDYITKNGGEILYNTKFEKFIIKNDKVVGVVTDKGEFSSEVVVLALGHSARDTIKNIRNQQMNVEAKPFSVGFRIEHNQAYMDEINYGKAAKDGILPHVEYSLSTNTKDRGVYTFCMCPGGVVVPAMSEKKTVITNGMSDYLRNQTNSNSAVCCSINLRDVNNDVDTAESFISEIEKKAFILGGSDYSAPSETVGSYLKGKNNIIKDIIPSYMNNGVKMTKLDSLFPDFVNDSLKKGLFDFGHKIKGFDYDYAVLTGPETRTSSPIRINRNDELQSLKYENVYPCGEGAGYAGGITSASIDGIKCAQKIINKFKPLQ